MIDLHAHVLPGLDDGPVTLEDSVALARAAVADGIRAMAATPHVRDDFPTTPEQMERLVTEVQSALAAAGVPLTIHRGGEVALDRLDALGADVRRFTLAGSRYILLEFPYQGWPLDLGRRLFELQLGGLVPVLGHPERNPEVRANPDRLKPAVESGALVQLTAASLDGRLGRATKRTALDLVEAGLVHLIASDAHGHEVRGAGLSRAVAELDEPKLGHWLTRAVPAAMVADEPLPARPATKRRRRFTLRGR